MTRDEINTLLQRKSAAYQMTGSRYICQPAPTNTDEDYIALMPSGMEVALELAGFVMNTDPEKYQEMPDFLAFRCGEFNVIVTHDPAFYRAFVSATEEAKRLNLIEKADRIALFQRVLYGQTSTGEIPL